MYQYRLYFDDDSSKKQNVVRKRLSLNPELLRRMKFMKAVEGYQVDWNRIGIGIQCWFSVCVVGVLFAKYVLFLFLQEGKSEQEKENMQKRKLTKTESDSTRIKESLRSVAVDSPNKKVSLLNFVERDGMVALLQIFAK